MSVIPIHLLGSPILREKSDEVDQIDDEVRELVQNLFDTVHAADGVGLAANQAGIAKRIAVVELENSDPITLINPVIVEQDGTDRAEEGCLSIPEIFGEVDRSTTIVVETTTLGGERIKIEAADLGARVIQHEIDHLDGVLFLDHLSPLKRRMLLQKWKKLRKGKTGYMQEVSQVASRA